MKNGIEDILKTGSQKGLANVMAKAATFNTMEQLERYVYGDLVVPGLNSISKITTASTGAYNTLYGAMTWNQLQTGLSPFALLPKKPWSIGYRMLTAYSSTLVEGIQEGASLSTPTDPTLKLWYPTAREMQNAYKISTKMEALQGVEDVYPKQSLVETKMLEHVRGMIEKALCPVATVAGYNIESLSRIISSNAERANHTGVGGYAATQYAPYNTTTLARTSGSAWDSQVTSASSATAFTLAMMDATVNQCRPYWNDPNDFNNKVWLTGYDTLNRIEYLLDTKYTAYTFPRTMGINVGQYGGVKIAGNMEAGFVCGAYKGIPIVASDQVNVGAVSSCTLQDIFLLDLDNLFFSTLLPTVHWEVDMTKVATSLNTQGYLMTSGEIVCTKFASQGKITDLKTA